MKQRDASYRSNCRSRAASGSTWGLTAALVLGIASTIGLPIRTARADDVDDTVKKLIDLDQRVHLMSLEFKEAPPPAPDAADRRVLDAQVEVDQLLDGVVDLVGARHAPCANAGDGAERERCGEAPLRSDRETRTAADAI